MASNSNVVRDISLALSLLIALLSVDLECFSSLAFASELETAPTTCKATQCPGYCEQIFEIKPNQTEQERSHSSLKRSVSQASQFLHLIRTYITKAPQLRLTASVIGALKDCRQLAELNVDYLFESLRHVENEYEKEGEDGTSYSSKSEKSLPSKKYNDVRTLLSGVLTNQQTCLDGIKDAGPTRSLKKDVIAPLSNDTKLYSISLTLFTKGWVPVKEPRSSRPGPKGGRRKQAAFQLPATASELLQQRKPFKVNSDRDDDDDNDDDKVLIRDMVTVSKDGRGDFRRINDAVSAAPNNSDGSQGYFLIYVAKGVYKEYVNIDQKKTYVMMIGEGINKTIITGNRSNGTNYSTYNSATFAVLGKGFVGMNMTIRNTAGAIGNQAVALRNEADLSTFYRCSFEGYQDTLYVKAMRQFYRDCCIYGTVDFIFGNAKAVFQNCKIFPRVPLPSQYNVITAHGRPCPDQNTGLSFYNCAIRPARDLAKSNRTIQTFLGRPWKQFARTVFMQTYIDRVVNPAGWREWNGDFALDTLYYGEYNNIGPGANTANRVNWPGYHKMNDIEASMFTVSNFVGDDWLPQTGIPYTSGLK